MRTDIPSGVARSSRQRAHHHPARRRLDRDQRRDRDDLAPGGLGGGHAVRRVLQGVAAGRVGAEQLGREQVRLRVGLGHADVVGAHQRVEPQPGPGQHRVHEPALGPGHQRVRQAGRRDLGQQLARARLDRHAAVADPLGDAGHEPLGDLLGRRGPGRLGQQVAHRAVQAAAEQLHLVRGGPVGAEPGHDGRLGLEPERLGVDEQPVHVEQHRDAGLRPRLSQTLKYFASGWCRTMASVDCSGCSCISSDSSTPIRDGSSRRTILARSARSGQAG